MTDKLNEKIQDIYTKTILSEGKGLSDADLPKIADNIVRYFVGNPDSAAKALQSIKNKGFAVSQEVISGNYNDLFNKYHKQITKLLKSMKKDFEG